MLSNELKNCNKSEHNACNVCCLAAKISGNSIYHKNQILLLWQPFTPKNIQDIHSDIKNNY